MVPTLQSGSQEQESAMLNAQCFSVSVQCSVAVEFEWKTKQEREKRAVLKDTGKISFLLILLRTTVHTSPLLGT